jgi:sec-independent protein translocase protein TatA
MPFNLGGPELLVVLVIVLIVFGAGKLPNVMRDLGTGVREFKKAQTDEERAAAASNSSASPAPPVTTTSTIPAAPAPSADGSATVASRTPETSSRA